MLIDDEGSAVGLESTGLTIGNGELALGELFKWTETRPDNEFGLW